MKKTISLLMILVALCAFVSCDPEAKVPSLTDPVEIPVLKANGTMDDADLARFIAETNIVLSQFTRDDCTDINIRAVNDYDEGYFDATRFVKENGTITQESNFSITPEHILEYRFDSSAETDEHFIDGEKKENKDPEIEALEDAWWAYVKDATSILFWAESTGTFEDWTRTIKAKAIDANNEIAYAAYLRIAKGKTTHEVYFEADDMSGITHLVVNGKTASEAYLSSGTAELDKLFNHMTGDLIIGE